MIIGLKIINILSHLLGLYPRFSHNRQSFIFKEYDFFSNNMVYGLTVRENNFL
jgi:hypothetical protein